MTHKRWLWLSAIVILAVLVAYQVVVTSAGDRDREFAARADVPTVQPGVDVLGGITIIPWRVHHYDYHRAAFGDAWTDDNDAPGGHNGCDTRDDVLNRDLVDKTYVSTKRCPDAVETGTLHDPYTNATINFHRGAKVGEAVQIDHIVPLALAWDMGAYDWPVAQRIRFANDPANLACRTRSGESGQRRFSARTVDAAQRRIPLPVRHAVHRGVPRIRASGRFGVEQRVAPGCRHVPDEVEFAY